MSETQTSTSKRLNALLGVVTGLMALVAHYLSFDSSLASLSLIVSAIIFCGSIMLPLFPALILLSVFSFCLFITDTPAAILDSSRLALFGVVVLALRYRLPALPPVYVVSILWFMFFLLTYLFFADSSTLNLNLLRSEFAYSMLVEILIVSVLGTFACTKSIMNSLGLKPITTELRPFFLQLTLIPVLVVGVLSFATALKVGPIPFKEALDYFASHSFHFALLLALGALLPLVVGLILSEIIQDFANALVQGVSDKHPLARDDVDKPWSMFELRNCYEKVLDSLDQQVNDARSARHELKELARTSSENEAALKKREINAINLLKLTDAAPWGAITVRANKTVVQANKTMRSLLGINERKLASRTFSALISSHPWSNELIEVLNWCCENYRQVLECNNMRFFSSVFNGKYLELQATAQNLDDSELIVGGDIEHRAPTDVLLTVYGQARDDFRQLQLLPFSPNREDIVLRHCQATCGRLQEQLEGVIDDAAELNRILEHGSKQEQDANLRLISQDIDRIASEAYDALRSTAPAPIIQEQKTICLTIEIRRALEYLYEMMQIDKPPEFLDSSRGEEEVDGEATASFKRRNPDLPLVEISAYPDDFMRFLSYFLSLLKAMIEQEQEISISLATEHIGTGTANILSTSASGSYARIELHHRVQSITPNMTLRTFAELSASPRALIPIEVAISLLTYQVRRLGGFISVQSSANRGTDLSLYLPINLEDSKKTASSGRRVERQKRGTLHTRPHENKGTALLVSPDSEEADSIVSMLSEMGYQVDRSDPEKVHNNNHHDPLLGFGGQGFGSAYRSVLPGLEETKQEDEKVSYDLLVLNTTEELHLDNSFFQKTFAIYPKLPALVLYPPGIEKPSGKRGRKSLAKPFGREQLTAAVSELISSLRPIVSD